MFIHGREVRFLLSTGAMKEISEACPDKDLRNLSKTLSNTADSFDIIAKMAVSMSKWYEIEQAYVQKGYKGIALAYNECMVMDLEEFGQLTNEVMEAFQAGQKTTIETEPIKKKEE